MLVPYMKLHSKTTLKQTCYFCSFITHEIHIKGNATTDVKTIFFCNIQFEIPNVEKFVHVLLDRRISWNKFCCYTWTWTKRFIYTSILVCVNNQKKILLQSKYNINYICVINIVFLTSGASPSSLVVFSLTNMALRSTVFGSVRPIR